MHAKSSSSGFHKKKGWDGFFWVLVMPRADPKRRAIPKNEQQQLLNASWRRSLEN